MAKINFIVSCFLLLVNSVASNDHMKCKTSISYHFPESENYELQLSTHEYNTEEFIEIKVTVQLAMEECPAIDSIGPHWYSIQALSDERELLGKFKDPKNPRTEAVTTSLNRMVEFSTPEPVAVIDLPMSFSWNKTAADKGRICFWLTLLENNKCTRAKQCILPIGYEADDDNSAEGDITNNVSENPTKSVDVDESATSSDKSVTKAPVTTLSEDEEDEEAAIAAKIAKKCFKDCSESRKGEFCTVPTIPNASKSNYTSRCEWQIEKCSLKEKGIDVSKIDLVQCSNIPSIYTTQKPKATPCWDQRNSLSDLGAKCTHDGQFKIVQCLNGECFCMNEFGIVFGRRHSLCDEELNLKGFKDHCSQFLPS